MADGDARLSLTDRELADRLGWFTHVRWAIGIGALLMMLVSWHLFGVRFQAEDGSASISPAVGAILAVFLYNAAFTFIVRVVRSRGIITRRLIVELALGQLVCDMIAVCAIAHYTGGVENVFIILVLLPLVIATDLLPPVLAYATAAAAAAIINALAWSEQQGLISHIHLVWPGKERGVGSALYADPLYVLQVTAALTVTIFVIVLVDTSISKRLRTRESELEDAYRQLELADEAKSFFMRKAGHELRAPLAAIHSILEAILHTSSSLEQPHRRLMVRTQLRTQAMMAMVDDLRRYSYLRSPAGAVQVASAALADVVNGTIELFQQQARDAGLQLHRDIRPVRIDGDEELLREVVTNLVANAIQYTRSGGAVSVSLHRQGGQATLRVADTGIGMSDEAKESLFREFYRAPEARKVLPEGTGLGLAITRQIVRMHGGSMEVDSAAGKGATFTVHLPVEAPAAAPPGQGATQGRGLGRGQPRPETRK